MLRRAFSRQAAAALWVACGAAVVAALAAPAAQAGWRSAPIVPRLDAPTQKQVLITARRGRTLGNHANVLAKVGDSISQSAAFLDPLGCGQWRLGAHRSLGSTIRVFSARSLPGRSLECASVNSFSRESAATLVIRTSSWAITPGAAVDPACGADESPLVCEIRLTRPAYAVILIGTNDVTIGNLVGGDPIPDFLTNMRIIVHMSRRLGVVPILNTLPPRTENAEREAMTEQLNAGLVSLARSLHVPLINLWRALAGLPAEGLSDGLHLSVSGWPGCSSPCDPNSCQPNCFAANFTPAGLMYGNDRRNLITLLTLRRIAEVATRPRR